MTCRPVNDGRSRKEVVWTERVKGVKGDRLGGSYCVGRGP